MTNTETTQPKFPSPCPTLDQLTELYRENGFEIIDTITITHCAGKPRLNIVRFAGDDEEGKRAVDVAKQNGHGFWLRDLQRTWNVRGGDMADVSYLRLIFYVNSTNWQG